MSSKIDLLLKKATTFERLALYGDRQNFLQALSQNLPRVIVPNDGSSGGHLVDPNPQPSFKPLPPAPLPKVLVPSQDGGQWLDPEEALNEPTTVDHDPNIMSQKQLNAPYLPEHAVPPGKPSIPYAIQLIRTLNAFSEKATVMNDTQKASVLKQLNNTTLAELSRVLQELGGYNNPYATPQEQTLAQQIRDAVSHLGTAFSAQITEAPNYAKLS